MPDEFAHDAESIAQRDLFDREANIAEPHAFRRGLDRAAQRGLRDAQKTLRPFIDHADRNGVSGVPHPTVLDHADVELDDVAVLDPALAPDAVHDFVIERDANIPGENAMPDPITEESALHAGFLHEIGRGLVHFLRRNAGANQILHPIENLAGRAAGAPHFFDFLCALDRNHADCSINREISPKTASRSRFPSILRSVPAFS